MSRDGVGELYCPKCGCLMKVRDGKFGKFYGCTGYPKCMNTFNMRDGDAEIRTQLGADEPEDDDMFHPGHPRFYGDN